MLMMQDYCFQKAAEEALLKIVTSGDQDKLFKMLENYDGVIHKAAGKAFVKIAGPEDREKTKEKNRN